LNKVFVIQKELDEQGCGSRQRQEMYLCSKMPRTVLGSTQSRIHCVTGFFPGVKTCRLEVDRTSASSTNLKNEWHRTSAVLMCLHGLGQRYLFSFFLLPFVVLRKLLAD